MDWEIVLPLFQRLLHPGGVLAIVHRSDLPPPWHDGLREVIVRHSTYSTYEDIDLIAELECRDLFTHTGSYESSSVETWQTVDDYIESFHSRSSLARSAMTADSAAAFDAALRDLVEPWTEEGRLALQTVGQIDWGKPGSKG
jgi:hypothetical protein